MIHFTIRCNVVPGREEELDQFLEHRAKPLWLSHPGVTGFHLYRDVLDGSPERTVVIDVEDLGHLQSVLESEERKRLRREFQGYLLNVEGQILTKVF